MRETSFIKQNKEKWNEFEQILEQNQKDPDRLSDLFIEITNDLAYSRTHYPNRSVRVYLNSIAQLVFHNIYKNRKHNLKRFIFFWKEELPYLVYQTRKPLLFSLLVFFLAVFIGAISTAYNSDFPRYILGSQYIHKTIEHIKNGDPMAIYKQDTGVHMFLGITLNNTLVAFQTFLLGIFFAIGSVAMLIYNGIMVGTFQYFFFQRGLFMQSALTIWLHGTLEISSLIIAAGAGITMGRGLLFPGTYSRLQSFKISTGRGLKLLLGILPILIFAAFIESFLSRYTGAPSWAKGGLIIVSLTFVLGYFVWTPYMKSKRGFKAKEAPIRLPVTREQKISLTEIKTNGELLKDAFIYYKKNAKKIILFALISSLFYSLLIATLFTNVSGVQMTNWLFILTLFDYKHASGSNIFFVDSSIVLYLVNTLLIAGNIFYSYYLMSKINLSNKEKFGTFLRRNLHKPLIVIAMFNAMIYTNNVSIILLGMLVFPMMLLWMYTAIRSKKYLIESMQQTFSLLNGAYGKMAGLYLILVLISTICFFLANSPLVYTYYHFISWNFIFDQNTAQFIYMAFLTFMAYAALSLVIPLISMGIGFLYHTLKEIKEAGYLKEQINRLAIKKR